MTIQKLIIVHVHSLAQLVPLQKNAFPDIRTFNIYKKQEIYAKRNQYLSEFTQQEVTQDSIAITDHGKPFLMTTPSCYFNHSHSQKNYALALSSSISDIGIDVEDLDRKVRFEALAQHAFHLKELEIWNSLDQSKEYWFKVWTTKEAVLKAAGLGIRINLNEFDTQVQSEQNGGICYHPAIGSFAYQNFNLNNVMLTVAWRTQDISEKVYLPEIQVHQH